MAIPCGACFPVVPSDGSGNEDAGLRLGWRIDRQMSSARPARFLPRTDFALFPSARHPAVVFAPSQELHIKVGSIVNVLASAAAFVVHFPFAEKVAVPSNPQVLTAIAVAIVADG